MQFSIDKNRLEDFRSRFKVANGITNEAFQGLGKAEDLVADAKNEVSRLNFETRNIRGSKEQRGRAEQNLAKASGERDKAHERYVEVCRQSSYFGTLFDRCKRYADAQATIEAATAQARIEAAAEAASNAAYAKLVADKGGQQ